MKAPRRGALLLTRPSCYPESQCIHVIYFIFHVLLCVTLKHTKVIQSDMKRRLDDTKWQISCEGFWFVFPALILKCTGTEESSVYPSFSSALVSPTCSLQDYMLQQTMLRVKDAWTFSRRATLELTQYVWKQPVEQLNSIWVLFIINNIPPPVSNWGTECDADLSYHNGNNEPRGFGENLFVQRSDRFVCFSMLYLLWLSLLSYFHAGHIGIAVPDVYAACKLFEEQGVCQETRDRWVFQSAVQPQNTTIVKPNSTVHQSAPTCPAGGLSLMDFFKLKKLLSLCDWWLD